MKRILANLLILAGLIFLTLSLFFLWQRFNPNRLAFTHVDESFWVNNEIKSDVKPISLTIEDLDISLPVISQKYEKGRWETTVKGVSYLISSAIPGEAGNSVFYGHNFKNIFGNLKNAQPGQMIKVEMSDGKVKNFRIEYVQVVNADQTGILSPTDDKRITVYTCTGLLDTKRFVVTALLDERS